MCGCTLHHGQSRGDGHSVRLMLVVSWRRHIDTSNRTDVSYDIAACVTYNNSMFASQATGTGQIWPIYDQLYTQGMGIVYVQAGAEGDVDVPEAGTSMPCNMSGTHIGMVMLLCHACLLSHVIPLPPQPSLPGMPASHHQHAHFRCDAPLNLNCSVTQISSNGVYQW